MSAMASLPGQFYDYFEKRNVSVPAEPPGLAERHNRRYVVQHLINDAMENDYPVCHLYAMLLVHTFCQADPDLMREFGAEIAKYLHDEPNRENDEDERPRRRTREVEEEKPRRRRYQADEDDEDVIPRRRRSRE